MGLESITVNNVNDLSNDDIAHKKEILARQSAKERKGQSSLASCQINFLEDTRKQTVVFLDKICGLIYQIPGKSDSKDFLDSIKKDVTPSYYEQIVNSLKHTENVSSQQTSNQDSDVCPCTNKATRVYQEGSNTISPLNVSESSVLPDSYRKELITVDSATQTDVISLSTGDGVVRKLAGPEIGLKQPCETEAGETVSKTDSSSEIDPIKEMSAQSQEVTSEGESELEACLPLDKLPSQETCDVTLANESPSSASTCGSVIDTDSTTSSDEPSQQDEVGVITDKIVDPRENNKKRKKKKGRTWRQRNRKRKATQQASQDAGTNSSGVEGRDDDVMTVTGNELVTPDMDITSKQEPNPTQDLESSVSSGCEVTSPLLDPQTLRSNEKDDTSSQEVIFEGEGEGSRTSPSLDKSKQTCDSTSTIADETPSSIYTSDSVTETSKPPLDKLSQTVTDKTVDPREKNKKRKKKKGTWRQRNRQRRATKQANSKPGSKTEVSENNNTYISSVEKTAVLELKVTCADGNKSRPKKKKNKQSMLPSTSVGKKDTPERAAASRIKPGFSQTVPPGRVKMKEETEQSFSLSDSQKDHPPTRLKMLTKDGSDAMSKVARKPKKTRPVSKPSNKVCDKDDRDRDKYRERSRKPKKKVHCRHNTKMGQDRSPSLTSDFEPDISVQSVTGPPLPMKRIRMEATFSKYTGLYWTHDVYKPHTGSGVQRDKSLDDHTLRKSKGSSVRDPPLKPVILVSFADSDSLSEVTHLTDQSATAAKELSSSNHRKKPPLTSDLEPDRNVNDPLETSFNFPLVFVRKKEASSSLPCPLTKTPSTAQCVSVSFVLAQHRSEIHTGDPGDSVVGGSASQLRQATDGKFEVWKSRKKRDKNKVSLSLLATGVNDNTKRSNPNETCMSGSLEHNRNRNEKLEVWQRRKKKESSSGRSTEGDMRFLLLEDTSVSLVGRKSNQYEACGGNSSTLEPSSTDDENARDADLFRGGGSVKKHCFDTPSGNSKTHGAGKHQPESPSGLYMSPVPMANTPPKQLEQMFDSVEYQCDDYSLSNVPIPFLATFECSDPLSSECISMAPIQVCGPIPSTVSAGTSDDLSKQGTIKPFSAMYEHIEDCVCLESATSCSNDTNTTGNGDVGKSSVTNGDSYQSEYTLLVVKERGPPSQPNVSVVVGKESNSWSTSSSSSECFDDGALHVRKKKRRSFERWQKRRMKTENVSSESNNDEFDVFRGGGSESKQDEAESQSHSESSSTDSTSESDLNVLGESPLSPAKASDPRTHTKNLAIVELQDAEYHPKELLQDSATVACTEFQPGVTETQQIVLASQPPTIDSQVTSLNVDALEECVSETQEGLGQPHDLVTLALPTAPVPPSPASNEPTPAVFEIIPNSFKTFPGQYEAPSLLSLVDDHAHMDPILVGASPHPPPNDENDCCTLPGVVKSFVAENAFLEGDPIEGDWSDNSGTVIPTEERGPRKDNFQQSSSHTQVSAIMVDSHKQEDDTTLDCPAVLDGMPMLLCADEVGVECLSGDSGSQQTSYFSFTSQAIDDDDETLIPFSTNDVLSPVSITNDLPRLSCFEEENENGASVEAVRESEDVAPDDVDEDFEATNSDSVTVTSVSNCSASNHGDGHCSSEETESLTLNVVTYVYIHPHEYSYEYRRDVVYM